MKMEMRMPPMSLLLLLLLSLPLLSMAVDNSKFRTCDQTQFCHKHRFASAAAIHVVPNSVQVSPEVIQFQLLEQANADTKDHPSQVLKAELRFVLSADDSAVPAVRLHVSEQWADPSDVRTRWENQDVLLDAANHLRKIQQVSLEESGLKGLVGPDVPMFFRSVDAKSDVVVAVHLAPFGVDVFVDKHKVVTTNADHRFHFETRQQGKGDASSSTSVGTNDDVHGGKTVVDYGEDGKAIYADGTTQGKDGSTAGSTPAPTTEATTAEEGWEEEFGGHKDKKKFGPASIGLDIAFPAAPQGLYGIPEHADDFRLKDTIKLDGETETAVTDPYRLFNLDVFEYDLGVPMSLYGSIPLLVAPSTTGTVGVFWHNPSETFVDVITKGETKHTHWMSESGVLDLFVLLGPTVPAFFSQYTLLTGRAPLPPLFAVAYHQCRWNYKNEDDVARVNAGFDEHLIPYDVMWLDIEHTDGKRYFTWDKNAFPTPKPMQEKLARVGRQMVTIVDPHIKVDDGFAVYKEATDLGLFVKDEQGADYHGWCWPGDAAYVDFTSLKARRWWSSRFRYDKYEGSTPTLFTWNDMNEPSVFNGPEVTMRKTCTNLAGIEHREWHNLYGMYMQQATMEGQLVRQLPAAVSENEVIPVRGSLQRPFVLGRSFFAGSQRYGAVWTGDNQAQWDHLKYSTKMLLSLSSAALSFVGADVGGFFGNPDTELLTRWYQSATWQPFFRGHAHHDSNRREPYVFGEPHTTRLRNAIRTRYAWLPYTYTTFYECEKTGMPVLRALWMEFPEDTTSYHDEDQFMLGSDVLVHPITAAGVEKESVYLPGKPEDVWYHVFDGYRRFAGGQRHEGVAAPIDFSPVFQRGGSVVARKQRVRRSSRLMQNDPVTLVVALDAKQEAKGKLYLDDESSYAYSTDGKFTLVNWTVSSKGIESHVQQQQFASPVWVERIEVYGFRNQAPKKVWREKTEVEASYDATKDVLIIRKPGVLAKDAWTLRFE